MSAKSLAQAAREANPVTSVVRNEDGSFTATYKGGEKSTTKSMVGLTNLLDKFPSAKLDEATQQVVGGYTPAQKKADTAAFVADYAKEIRDAQAKTKGYVLSPEEQKILSGVEQGTQPTTLAEFQQTLRPAGYTPTTLEDVNKTFSLLSTMGKQPDTAVSRGEISEAIARKAVEDAFRMGNYKGNTADYWTKYLMVYGLEKGLKDLKESNPNAPIEGYLSAQGAMTGSLFPAPVTPAAQQPTLVTDYTSFPSTAIPTQTMAPMGYTPAVTTPAMSTQQYIQSQMPQMQQPTVFGVPKQDVQQFILNRMPGPRSMAQQPQLMPSVSQQYVSPTDSMPVVRASRPMEQPVMQQPVAQPAVQPTAQVVPQVSNQEFIRRQQPAQGSMATGLANAMGSIHESLLDPVAAYAKAAMNADNAPTGRMGLGQANVRFLKEGGAVKKFADGGPSSGVRRLEMSGYQEGGEVTPVLTPEQLDEFNRNMQRELDEENRRFQESGGQEFYSAIRPAMEDINERVKQTLDLYRMGRATEADVRKLIPSMSEWEIASQFGRTDTGGYRLRDIDAPSKDRLREFIEIQKPTIDASRPDMFPYNPRGSKAQERVLKMSEGGDVTDDAFIQEMMTGTLPTDQETSPGLLPPELREAIDVPLDLANLAIRGTAGAVAGPVYGLYKGLTSDKFGTEEGVAEARSEAERVMGEITGEPKTQAAKDIMQFVGEKLEAAKIPPMPQFLTTPVPGPGSASALMRSYELAETPPSGVVKMPGGNWLKGQVEYFVRPMKKDIPWTQSQLEEMPEVTEAVAPDLALNKFVDNAMVKYIKNEMASEKDTLRNLADENTLKASKAYEAQLKQVQKAYDRAEKIKAEGPRPGMAPGVWENAIEAQLGRAQQMERDAKEKVDFELRHVLPFPVVEGQGLANPFIRQNLERGGQERLVSRRKEAGQAEEGVAKTAAGKAWETMADLFIKPQTAGQITDQDYFMRATDSQRVLRNNPWLATVPPEAPVYIPQDVVRSSGFFESFSPGDLGLKHITDELANAMDRQSGLPAKLLLTPDEVASMGIEKAARHVIEINKWREAEMGAANALRAQKSISLYKDYPTIPGKTEPNSKGLQWQELKLIPKDDTPESMALAKEDLADALKYEGEVMGHCVGGECPRVESGKSRIISLRDAKGEPHVTLEVIPPQVNFVDVIGGNPAFPDRDPELYRMMDTMTTAEIEQTPLYKEKAAAIAAQKPPGIRQIKGKGNRKPPDSYQPFITDLIASRRWSFVEDLQNTNLVPIKPTLLKNAEERGFNPQVVLRQNDQTYITKEEFNRLADLFGGMNKYAAGGEVTDFIKRVA